MSRDQQQLFEEWASTREDIPLLKDEQGNYSAMFGTREIFDAWCAAIDLAKKGGVPGLAPVYVVEEKTKEAPIELLNQYLRYEPETGNLFWKIRRAMNARAERPAGSYNKKAGYCYIKLFNRQYANHRLAWALTYGEWPAGHIDHINGDRSDNRIANLRVATRSQNNQNQGLRKNSATGYKGVSWNARVGKFAAHIGHRRKNHHLGYFDTAEAAHQAYCAAAKEKFGEFARFS